MNEPMQVIFTASRNLYPYITGAIYSLLHFNPNTKVWLFLEDDDVPYKLPEQCEVVNVSGQKFWDEKCPNINTPYTYLSLMRATYAKLFTGKPNKYGIRTLPYVDKIFQLDVDTIVCESLLPIWNLNMDSKYFAATQEFLSVHKPREQYWNLGFALFGLDAIRKDGVDDRVIEELRTVKWPWIDQDVFDLIG